MIHRAVSRNAVVCIARRATANTPRYKAVARLTAPFVL
jgi:hypothetical protein